MSNSMMVTASSADVQVVAAASRILVDVQTWHFDTAGQSRRDHACAGLSVSEARRLYTFQGKAIALAAEAEPRQGRIQLPSGTHNWTQPGRPGGPPAETRQTRVPAIDGPFGGGNGNSFGVPATKRAEPAGRRQHGTTGCGNTRPSRPG
jgi:hypothetical protein